MIPMAWSRATPPAFAGGVPSSASFILADEVCPFNEKKNRVIRPDPRILPHAGAFPALARPFSLQNRPSRPVLIPWPVARTAARGLRGGSSASSARSGRPLSECRRFALWPASGLLSGGFPLHSGTAACINSLGKSCPAGTRSGSPGCAIHAPHPGRAGRSQRIACTRRS